MQPASGPPAVKGASAASLGDVTAQGSWLLVTPSYQVFDAIGVLIAGSISGSGLFATYDFAIPNPANEGVWEGRTAVDFGPYQAPGADTTSFNVLSLAIPNDDFANATTMASMPHSTAQEMWAATTASDDPVYPCTGEQHYRSVWFRFTPATLGELSLNTYPSTYDTVLAVWTGARGSLTNVACNDDAAGGRQSVVTVPLAAGTDYYIEVAAYSRWDSGSLNLSATVAPLFRIFFPVIIR
jgi:hypothetical protein